MRTNRILRAATRPLRRLGDTKLADAARDRQVGQVLPIFAVMSVVLLGGAALLTDVAWWWTNELRMQRAADAASLAGAVYLPSDEARAFAAAWAEAEKNGYRNAGNVVVTPRRDPDNLRKLIVDIDAPVQTNFARVFCWQGGPCLQQVDIGVTGAAEFVLPVPMGSPENYYGVFGNVRGMTSTETQTVVTPQTDRDWSCGSGSNWQSASCTGRVPSVAQAGTWTATSGSLSGVLGTNNDAYARTGTTDAQQQWSGFNAQSSMPPLAAGETLDIVGLQVRLSDAFVNSSCSNGNARIGVELSWAAGVVNTWTSVVQAPASGSLGTSTTSGDYTIGSSTDMSVWGGHTWTRDEFSDANFRIRLTAIETCTGTKTFSVDRVEVRITSDHNYTTTTTTTVTTNLGDVPLEGPGTLCNNNKLGPGGEQECFEADNNEILNPRGFWATLNTQGAENVNGDAHQPGYDERTSQVALNCPSDTMACYDGDTFYNYAIEMAPGSTGGRVWIFDPQFCDVANNRGTGDRWFGGDAPVSTFYELWDTGTNRADPGDDTRLAYSDGRFRGLDADDSTMGGSGGAECMYRTDTLYGDGRDYHNRWYLLYSGMSGGTNGHVYRVHTTSTDPGAPTQQLGTNGENSFAIYASSTTGAAPKVYGLGAMQAFTPLRDNGGAPEVSEFYLAQIEAAHKGKTIEIRLWDPGDTGDLGAELQLLRPEGSGWTEADFSYSASPGTTHSNVADCAGETNGTSLTNFVQTNVGGGAGGVFNGCWLVLRSVIPDTYDADMDGWWRIRYRMTGNDTSDDVTTWTVNLIGNPVHLVMP